MSFLTHPGYNRGVERNAKQSVIRFSSIAALTGLSALALSAFPHWVRADDAAKKVLSDRIQETLKNLAANLSAETRTQLRTFVKNGGIAKHEVPQIDEIRGKLQNVVRATPYYVPKTQCLDKDATVINEIGYANTPESQNGFQICRTTAAENETWFKSFGQSLRRFTSNPVHCDIFTLNCDINDIAVRETNNTYVNRYPLSDASLQLLEYPTAKDPAASFRLRLCMAKSPDGDRVTRVCSEMTLNDLTEGQLPTVVSVRPFTKPALYPPLPPQVSDRLDSGKPEMGVDSAPAAKSSAKRAI
jgi:hypothetical protein